MEIRSNLSWKTGLWTLFYQHFEIRNHITSSIIIMELLKWAEHKQKNYLQWTKNKDKPNSVSLFKMTTWNSLYDDYRWVVIFAI